MSESRNKIILKLNGFTQYLKKQPVDLELILKKLKIKLKKINYGNDDVSGSIRKSGDKFIIYVNNEHPTNRQRFTIAHEIAHFLLHKDKIGDGITEDALFRNGKINLGLEREANSLAAEILIPFELIEKSDIENKTVKKLAKEFGVSESTMAIRINRAY